MSEIPKLLTTIGGVRVTDVNVWENYRRGEILNLLCEYVYGVRDIERPENLKFNLKEEREEYGMRVKVLEGGFDSFAFPFKVYFPLTQKGAVPAFVYVMHHNMEKTFEFKDDGNMYSEKTESILPLRVLTDRGFAVAVMPTYSIYPDWQEHAEFKKGVFAAVKTPKGRQKNSWASISAWGWGVSRVVDYLETDSDIDSSKIAATGHSRSGKAALFAGATDDRIKLTAPNNSGCMGAAILRGKKGEHIKDINVSDWFCENFKAFNDREELLPIDQHMLLSLVAPRYLYVADSIEDEWCDPDAEFLAARLASEAYELYGVKGLVAPEKPILEEAYQKGRIAFHVKRGDHSQTMFDWNNLMNYFEKICSGDI